MLGDSVSVVVVLFRFGNNFHYIIYALLYRNENTTLRRKNTKKKFKLNQLFINKIEINKKNAFFVLTDGE